MHVCLVFYYDITFFNAIMILIKRSIDERFTSRLFCL